MNNNFDDFSWSLFASSGQLGYYMMYKAAQESKDIKDDNLI